MTAFEPWMKTPLSAWMHGARENDASLAAKVGVSRVQILRIRKGQSKPSPKLAQKLEKETGVPAWEFLRP